MCWFGKIQLEVLEELRMGLSWIDWFVCLLELLMETKPNADGKDKDYIYGAGWKEARAITDKVGRHVMGRESSKAMKGIRVQE